MIEIRHKTSGSVLKTVDAPDLYGANLKGAYLQDANLKGAYLRSADLQGADLQGADLRCANLQDANLQGANLQGANLQGAYLRSANLQDANLQGANLQGANLQGAYLYGANLPAFQLCEGDLIVYKKLNGGVIARLKISAKTERTASLVGRKCRAASAEVLNLIPHTTRKAYDQHTGKVLYKKGAIVTPDKYDPDPRVECTHGIHFFLTRAEAEAY